MKSKVPTRVAEYFGTEDVLVTRVYKTGTGWRDRNAIRPSLAKMRRYRAIGVTYLSFQVNGSSRYADFAIKELLR